MEGLEGVDGGGGYGGRWGEVECMEGGGVRWRVWSEVR